MFKTEIRKYYAHGHWDFGRVGAKTESVFLIAVPQSFSAFVDGALLRIQSKYPSLRFCALGSDIGVSNLPKNEKDRVRKDVLYALYREKIYVETLPLRKALIYAVTSQ
jgi:hypothetical protein